MLSRWQISVVPVCPSKSHLPQDKIRRRKEGPHTWKGKTPHCTHKYQRTKHTLSPVMSKVQLLSIYIDKMRNARYLYYE